jgi:hypothetical protein
LSDRQAGGGLMDAAVAMDDRFLLAGIGAIISGSGVQRVDHSGPKVSRTLAASLAGKQAITAAPPQSLPTAETDGDDVAAGLLASDLSARMAYILQHAFPANFPAGLNVARTGADSALAAFKASFPHLSLLGIPDVPLTANDDYAAIALPVDLSSTSQGRSVLVDPNRPSDAVSELMEAPEPRTLAFCAALLLLVIYRCT